MAEPSQYTDREIALIEKRTNLNEVERCLLATITADRRELEEYRQGWLVKENKKLKKRIEELEIKIKMSGMDKELYGEHIVDPVIAEANRLFSEQIADQTATIERLRGLLDRTINSAAKLKKAVLPSFVISEDLMEAIQKEMQVTR